eukprot:scaffold1272_cov250-Pinguiococcus_pyrenoidosus.AAC.43
MASSAASPVCNYEPMPGMDRPPRFGLVRGKAPSPSPVLTVRRPVRERQSRRASRFGILQLSFSGSTYRRRLTCARRAIPSRTSSG